MKGPINIDTNTDVINIIIKNKTNLCLPEKNCTGLPLTRLTRKANKSKDNITKILINENNISLDKVLYFDMLDLTMLDECFNISLTEFYIEKQILTFKRV